MKTVYPAIITYREDDGTYLVEFPDLPGCLTDGTDLEDAKAMAKEALSGYLMSVIGRGVEFNPPSTVPGAVMIEPEPSVAFAYWLRTMRKASGMLRAPLRLIISFVITNTAAGVRPTVLT